EQLTAKEHRIVVAGTHGKTTTTTLIGWLLETGGQKPDVITGMSSDYFGGSVRLKGSSKVVIEGDEYAASALDHASKFLYYHPDTLVLTSMDYDHPDMFKNFQSMVETYRHLIDDLSKDSKILACGDVPELVSVLRESGRKFVTYGLSTDC